MRSALVFVLLLFGSLAGAQSVSQPQSITLRSELAMLSNQALLLRDDLPSITCEERVLSRLTKKNKIVEEVRLTADVRVERKPNGEVEEQYDFRELNGRPYSGPQPRTPFFVAGSLNEALLFSFLPRSRLFCLR
jgi:hypothetical protein